MQYLYGSGEAAAISEQAYNMLVDAVRRRLASEQADPRRDTDRTSAVLTRDATIEQPTTVPCGALPRAAVFDVDETMLLNLGFEYNDAVHPGRRYDPARWADWEQTGVDRVVAVPGAVQAVTALRRMGVTVVFNTNRSAANAAFTEAALDRAGLGPARHGETLFLKGDVAGEANKDGRRALIASRYCVVAMGGDQLGDFSDLFDGGPPAVRRAAAQAPAIRGLWGRFWFMLPNPVYGSALTGGLDDLFPSDKRWPMPAQEK
ncbi:MAG: acid phosphatase [Sphingomonas sp. 28-66-16]|nr:MAG: acid phosphatase [Sphingomonas sp. 28-66-16]